MINSRSYRLQIRYDVPLVEPHTVYLKTGLCCWTDIAKACPDTRSRQTWSACQSQTVRFADNHLVCFEPEHLFKKTQTESLLRTSYRQLMSVKLVFRPQVFKNVTGLEHCSRVVRVCACVHACVLCEFALTIITVIKPRFRGDVLWR